jgi:hypothetical protein
VRVLNNGVFAAFHASDLIRLLVNGHVPVNNPEAALTRKRYGEFGLRDGVHRGGENRHVQADGGQFGAHIDFSRQNSAVRREEKDVVET